MTQRRTANSQKRFIYHSAREVPDVFETPVVTIGNFDGLHLGHRQILKKAKEMGQEKNSPCICLTFEPHPVRFFHREAPTFRLSPKNLKSRLIREQGLDGVLIMEFTEEIAQKEPVDFVDDILETQLNASAIVVGQDFRFGKERAGDTIILQQLCKKRGIETNIIPPVEYNGQRVSSTWIRKELSKGNLDLVSHLLDRPFCLEGEVVAGQGRGQKIGFPTANIECTNQLLPPKGVYITELSDSQNRYNSVTNVGIRPTFDQKNLTVETHVIDRDDLDLYGKTMSLAFLKYLRDEKSFDGVDELTEQIDDDIQKARQYFESEHDASTSDKSQ